MLFPVLNESQFPLDFQDFHDLGGLGIGRETDLTQKIVTDVFEVILAIKGMIVIIVRGGIDVFSLAFTHD